MVRFSTILPPMYVGLLVFMFGLAPAFADKAKTPIRNIGISTSKGNLNVSFNFKSVITPKIQEKLKSGLPTRVILQLNLEQKGKSSPISYFVRSCTIVYDLWEEEFVVTVEDNRGKRHAKVKTEQEAIELATTVSNEKIARIENQTEGNYRIRALVEVNPVSKEMVANIRKWLARPLAGKGGASSQTNYFGSFVGIFVDRRIGQADKTLNFISQWFGLGTKP